MSSSPLEKKTGSLFLQLSLGKKGLKELHKAFLNKIKLLAFS